MLRTSWVHSRCFHRARMTGLGTAKRTCRCRPALLDRSPPGLVDRSRRPALAFAGRVDTSAPATWRALARATRDRDLRTVRDTVRRASRQEPTRRSHRRPRGRSPPIIGARSERARPLTPSGEPHRARRRWQRSSRRRAPAAAKPKPRGIRPVALGSRLKRQPSTRANPSMFHPPLPAPPTPPAPRSRVHGVATASP
jgi:hypothetical protein